VRGEDVERVPQFNLREAVDIEMPVKDVEPVRVPELVQRQQPVVDGRKQRRVLAQTQQVARLQEGKVLAAIAQAQALHVS
jgi:hypothetical protein